MQHYWFKPKRYGFGAAPSSWQGWALTAAYVAILAALGTWLNERQESGLTTFIVLTGVVTVIFVGIAWRTTEGGWRWRWGDKD